MRVRAKFTCISVTDTVPAKIVSLRPVTSGSPENKSFSKFTPAGQLDLTIDKGTEAADFFVPGEEVYLTLEKA